MIAHDIQPIVGTSHGCMPGRVRIRLNTAPRRAYLRLYGLSFPLANVPALEDHDLDGREIALTHAQLAALNRTFPGVNHKLGPPAHSPFEAQEDALAKNSGEMQFLS